MHPDDQCAWNWSYSGFMDGYWNKSEEDITSDNLDDSTNLHWWNCDLLADSNC